MLTVLLGEKVRPLFAAAHTSNFLVTPSNALDATLWLLVVMYIYNCYTYRIFKYEHRSKNKNILGVEYACIKLYLQD